MPALRKGTSMKRLAVLVLGTLAAGCAMHPPAPPGELPLVASSDYELLWDATRRAVERHFDLYVQRKEEGYMMSTYKRGDPLPGGGLARDAQTRYDAEEDLLHITRRLLTARLLQDAPGIWVVHLEIIRERQGYQPPPAEGQDYGPAYDLYKRDKSALRDTADQTATVTWYRLGRDLWLENAILDRIRSEVERKGARVDAPVVEPLETPAEPPAVTP